jgi:hypothetical protein
MSNWVEEKNWSDKFEDQIKAVIAKRYIVRSSREEDRKQAHDLKVYVVDGLPQIAVRVRRFCYYEQYGDEFTIRTSAQPGMQSELKKIVSGWCQVYVYCFANEQEDGLHSWVMLDMLHFRSWYSDQLKLGKTPGKHSVNQDGSEFQVFKVDAIPFAVIMESNRKIEHNLFTHGIVLAMYKR